MKLLKGLFNLLSFIIAESIFTYLLLPLLFAGYFIIFDRFHITDTGLQVATVIFPLVIFAVIKAHREQRRTDFGVPSTSHPRRRS